LIQKKKMNQNGLLQTEQILTLHLNYRKKRAEYSSAYDPYALTDLLDWTAENTIGLPIKWAAQTETG
jgi:hypothetical protein